MKGWRPAGHGLPVCRFGISIAAGILLAALPIGRAMPNENTRYEVTLSTAGGLIPRIAGRQTDVATPVPKDKAAEFEKLLQAAGFFDLPSALAQSDKARDAMTYTLTVSKDGHSHTVKVGEGALSQELADLIDWVNRNIKRH
jgi:hypothetical protein